MAQIDVSGFIDYYDDDFALALESMFKRVVPGRVFTRDGLLAAFVEAVDEQFPRWEQVPPQYYIAD
jgi:hypothetical protein